MRPEDAGCYRRQTMAQSKSEARANASRRGRGAPSDSERAVQKGELGGWDGGRGDFSAGEQAVLLLPTFRIYPVQRIISAVMRRPGGVNGLQEVRMGIRMIRGLGIKHAVMKEPEQPKVVFVKKPTRFLSDLATGGGRIAFIRFTPPAGHDMQAAGSRADDYPLSHPHDAPDRGHKEVGHRRHHGIGSNFQSNPSRPFDPIDTRRNERLKQIEDSRMAGTPPRTWGSVGCLAVQCRSDLLASWDSRRHLVRRKISYPQG